MLLSPGTRPTRPGPAPESLRQRGLRVALLVQLVPRKRGSFEDWIVAMAREAASRGHRLDVFGIEPIDPAIREELAGAGSRWDSIDALLTHRLAGIRRLRQYQMVHLNMFPTRHPVSLMAYAAWPTRVIYVDHSSQAAHPPGHFQLLRSRFIDRFTMPRIGRVVGVSDFVRDRGRLEMGLPESRITTIYNGVDLARFTPNRSLKETRGFHVGCVANLIPAKGVETLIRALAQLNLPHWRLTVAGEGPDQPRLESVASELRVAGQIVFLGLRDDVPSLLRQCHVFVHPATWSEAFGLTITEAMASGCPVIASRVGAVPELIEHRESGLLFPPGDVKALAAALRMLYLDPRLAANLADQALKRVKERFSLDRCVEKHIDLIEELGTQRLRARGDSPSWGRAGSSFGQVDSEPDHICDHQDRHDLDREGLPAGDLDDRKDREHAVEYRGAESRQGGGP